MFTYDLMFIGLLSFAGGAGGLGIWLRRHPSQENAEKSSRVMHFLFFAGLGALFGIAFGESYLEYKKSVPFLIRQSSYE